jgi:hypothetical protein
VLVNGTQQDFGWRDEVLSKLSARPVPPAATAANLKIVSDTASGG